jgi:hypothetical protein
METLALLIASAAAGAAVALAVVRSHLRRQERASRMKARLA